MSQPRKLEVSDADLAKISASKRRREGDQVDPEWYFLAQFGMYFGFDGIRAIINNEIEMAFAEELMKAAQKVEYKDMFGNAQASFMGAASANAKKPGKAFDKVTGDLKKRMKVAF